MNENNIKFEKFPQNKKFSYKRVIITLLIIIILVLLLLVSSYYNTVIKLG